MAKIAVGRAWQRLKKTLGGLDHTVVVLAIASAISLAFGFLDTSRIAIGFGAAGLTFSLTRIASGKPVRLRHKPSTTSVLPTSPVAAAQAIAADDTSALVRQLMAQGRYALLLRPEIVANLNKSQYGRATEAMEEAMALVPAGEVTIGHWGDAPSDDRAPGSQVRVEHFFLDRYPVTNRQYYEFVASGGYEEMAIWDPEILPGVLDFVDQTRLPGPRFWKDGRYESGKDDHPVVGICWYEAAAYARWVGKRLPTGAEWEKAGSWPVQLGGGPRPQRRFPWGDVMDRRRANLWGSGPNDTISIHEFGDGISVGGVYQLVGNVWEWTSSTFGNWSYPTRDVVLSSPMKSIRGGAFDTYFDGQATCQFQSGEDAIARKHNVGFRCALSVCDLANEPNLPNEEASPSEETTNSESINPSVGQAEIEIGACA